MNRVLSVIEKANEVVDLKDNLPSQGVEDKVYVVKSDATMGNNPTTYIFRNGMYEILSGGGGGSSELQQKTKLGVTATSTNPNETLLSINQTTDFRRSPVEILKFIPGTQDVISTVANFDNADASSFDGDSQVNFDGKMYLKTTYQSDMVDGGALGSGKVFSAVIDKNSFSKFEKVEVI